MSKEASYGRGCFLANKEEILKKIIRKERLSVWNKRKCLKEMREMAEDSSLILKISGKMNKSEIVFCCKCKKALETNLLIDKDDSALCLQCHIKSDEMRLKAFEKKYMKNRERMRSYLSNWC